MTRFEEGNLLFTFGSEWTVLKFDEHKDYKKVANSLESIKGVDFLGIYGGQLYFYRSKRHARIPN